MLSNQQAERSGSASTIVGRSAPHRRFACAATAAAIPPTPVWRKTWVGDAGSASKASAAISS
jgi:hypothetical protein